MAADYDGLMVVDITNPAAPVTVAVRNTPGRAYSVEVSGDIAYVADYESGIQVFNIREPRDPIHLGSIVSAGKPLDVLIDGELILVASGSMGLKIMPRQCDAMSVVVNVDVKPLDDENRIKCTKASRALVPVAVLTKDNFDATTVDHTTVRLGPNEAPEAHANRHGPIRHEEDVDGDGDLDLVFHFRLADTGIQCGDTKVALTGETYDGQQIIGTDTIVTVSGGDKGPVVNTGIRITPNPFNPQTTISFYAEKPRRIRVAVYDIAGRRIAELTDQQYEMGEHSVTWQGRDSAGRSVPSGQYFFRVEAGGEVLIKKALLLK